MPKFKNIAVVGVGLIGASLASALKKYQPEIKITGVDSCAESIEKAESLGIIDQGFKKIGSNLKEAELIFIAVPVAAIPAVIKKIDQGSDKKQLLVDLGSTKKEIMLQAKKILTESSKEFIGGHPMAGSHKSGVEWHDSELFKGAPFILTPWLENDKGEKAKKKVLKRENLKELKTLIEALGAQVHIISASEHDRCTAYLSHLPHLLSSALVNLSDQKDFENKFLKLSGSGYRDMTRIAASSADLWQDIICSNRNNLAELIEKYIVELKELQHNLENNDQAEIYKFLAKAAELKKREKDN